ncbi:MAG: MFS transporter, partial [Brachybacterium tyrofermentans]
WFPREERGQAAGIWDSGSKWGSAIAPPVLTLLTLTFGWRSMFLIIGAAGVLLAVAFWAFYRAPEDSKHLSDDEYRHILAGRDDAAEEPVKIPWLTFFTYPQTWGLMLGFFSTIWIWNIFLTFLPLFLQNTLGVSIASTGWVAAVPYLAAALGAIFAGRVTVVLARRYKLSSMLSKKVILVGGCVALGVLLCIVPFVHNLALALLVLSLALAIVAAAQAQSWAISSDIVPDSHAARFGGIMNFGGYFGGALAPIVTGVVVDATGSYTPSFLVAGVIAVLGGVCYGLLVRKPIA